MAFANGIRFSGSCLVWRWSNNVLWTLIDVFIYGNVPQWPFCELIMLRILVAMATTKSRPIPGTSNWKCCPETVVCCVEISIERSTWPIANQNDVTSRKIFPATWYMMSCGCWPSERVLTDIQLIRVCRGNLFIKMAKGLLFNLLKRKILR